MLYSEMKSPSVVSEAQVVRVTPVMEAGISDHVWSLEEIVGLID
jgi:hypothetical protein